MDDRETEFTLTERLVVVAIIVCLVALVLGKVLGKVEQSEERTVHAAKVEYAALRAAYADGFHAPARPSLLSSAPTR